MIFKFVDIDGVSFFSFKLINIKKYFYFMTINLFYKEQVFYLFNQKIIFW